MHSRRKPAKGINIGLGLINQAYAWNIEARLIILQAMTWRFVETHPSRLRHLPTRT
jgi:hypothetical protein